MDMEKLKCATDFIDSYLADIVINEKFLHPLNSTQVTF